MIFLFYSAEPVTVVPASADGGTVGPLGATPTPAPVNAVERPRPSADVLNRQASFRGFGKLADNSPFKKQYSLRLNELPSNLQRQQQLGGLGRSLDSSGGQGMCLTPWGYRVSSDITGHFWTKPQFSHYLLNILHQISFFVRNTVFCYRMHFEFSKYSKAFHVNN